MGPVSLRLTCDDARFLLSRALDGDLDRAETRQLYAHLGQCDACRAYAAELADLESALGRLNAETEREILDERFDARVTDAVAGMPPKPAPPTAAGRGAGRLADGWRRWLGGWRPAITGLAGAVAGFLLAVLLAPDGGDKPGRFAPRFNLHPVAFGSAPERRDWTHEHTLQPGETLRKTVERSHDTPYHLRFRSSGPVEVSILHDAPGAEPDGRHRFTLEGTRYASLHAPRRQDVIVIRNEGATPIQVSGLTEHADAIKVRAEGAGKL